MYDTKTLRVRSGGRWVATAGAADLSNYATTAYVDSTQQDIMTAATAAFQERYTKQEVDGLFVKQADMVAPPSLDGYATEQYVDDSIARIPAVDAYTKPEVDAKVNVLALDIQAVNDQTAAYFQLFSDGLQPTFDAKADKATTYTKAEVDAKIPATGGSVDLSAYAKLNDTAQAITAKSATAETFTGVAFQFIKENAPSTAFALADVDGQERPVYAVGSKKFPLAFTTETTGSGSVDLSAYAKTVDNTQNIVANATVARGYTFGDSISTNNPGLVYTDTGEGYGLRLVLDTPTGKELIPYQSDFEPIRARMDALESKQVPAGEAVDLTPYAMKTDLLGLATETSIAATYLTKSDARVYTTAADVASAVSATYATKADTYTKVDVDEAFKKYVSANFLMTTFAPTYYTKTQSDARYANFLTIEVILDEVKKMLAGGKALPADVGWTKLLNAGSSTSSPPEAKVLNGIVYLRGEVVKSIGSGYIANVCQLPATIPPPPKEMVIPLACKNTSPAGRYYGYATFQTNRQIGVSCDNALNTIWLDGISYPAYE